MKLHILSDLHIEFERKFDTIFTPPKTDADAIILAGDIGVGVTEEWNYVRDVVQEHQKPVIFILGNHSYYQQEYNTVKSFWREQNEDGITFLDEGSSHTIDHVTFTGGTMWTDFDERNKHAMASAEISMNDYATILKDGTPLNPNDTVDEWIKTTDRIKHINGSNNNKKVVISHHLPSYRSIDPMFTGHSLNPAYASDMDDFIKDSDINLWIHGHTHTSMDYDINGTRIVCNPRGYAPYDLNPHFNSSMVVEV